MAQIRCHVVYLAGSAADLVLAPAPPHCDEYRGAKMS
jgi:hypothetical protein